MVLERIGTEALYALGLLALLVTATGLHGITSALFARRSKEFAIRMALGAGPRQIIGTILSSGLKLSAAGLALGLAIALPLGIMISSKEPGISAWSAPALGLSSVIVFATALVAAAHPARRVLRIQPADTVRAE